MLPAFDSQIGMVDRLGMVLFKQYALPFELASILFTGRHGGFCDAGQARNGRAKLLDSLPYKSEKRPLINQWPLFAF